MTGGSSTGRETEGGTGGTEEGGTEEALRFSCSTSRAERQSRGGGKGATVVRGKKRGKKRAPGS